MEDSDTGVGKFFIPILTPFLNKDFIYDDIDYFSSKKNIITNSKLSIQNCTMSNYIELDIPDKKPIKKHSNSKKTNKKPSVKTENKSNPDKNEPPKVKNPMTRAQIAEKKFGVESTWRPFEIFFNKQKKEDK